MVIKGSGNMNSYRKVERVAAYIRVSTQEQKLHGISLDAQKMKLIAYAKAHNMKIVEWYIDDGVSGRKLIRNRPELQRMIHDAEKDNFDRILFIKLDRFFRSVAEYHECMKRIAPVIWTATEEEYDLSTANGRMLVNMKLTIAEMEADMGGERIKIVNEYKVSTGQPLVGKQSLPFGFNVGTDGKTGRKNVIKDAEEAPILEDAIQHFMTHQSRRKTIMYLYSKYHISFDQKALTSLFNNPMLKGQYRDNISYCEAYIDDETFDRLVELNSRNIKDNTKPNRAYYFSGMIKCPNCGRVMGGQMHHTTSRYGKKYKYKSYRCAKWQTHGTCDYSKCILETTVEKIMLENIEQYLEDLKLESIEITESDQEKILKYDIEQIHEEIDRLNYSWQKGMIRKVEQYEKQYTELLEKLALAESERSTYVPRDFGKIEAILQTGWKEIYKQLDDESKRAFWRSFIESFEPDWNGREKKVKNIKFF